MSKTKKRKVLSFIKNHFMIIVMFAIILIPSIYTVLFLGSMWDPYGNTGNLPVAIVNQDKAFSYDGSVVNIGEQLCDNLAKNDSLQFNFVGEDVALRGLENGTYYMVMVIPENFSYNSTTLTTDNPQKMEMTYYTNPGTNYIASKFSESAVKTIKESLNKQVIGTYASTVYAKLDTIGEGFNAAANGSSQIYSGVRTLRSGNRQITDGLDTLSNGCLTLKEGTGTLKDGLKTYTDGVYQVDAGITVLQNGMNTLKKGTSQLTSNNQALNDGAEQLLEGLNLMSAQLGESLSEENLSDLQTLEDGLIQIKGVVDKIGSIKGDLDSNISEEDIKDFQNKLNRINTFVNSEQFDILYEIVNYDAVDWDNVINEIEKIEALPIKESTRKMLETLKEYAVKMKKLQEFEKKYSKEDIKNLVASANQISGNYNEVNSKVNDMIKQSSYALDMGSSTLKTLTNGLLSIQNGLDRTTEKDGEAGLIEGMTTLKNGISAYTNGVTEVDGGVDQLIAGGAQLKAGTTELVANNKKLLDGTVELNRGAVQLYDGSVKLYDGTLQIDNGCSRLMTGANTLEKSLKDGEKQIEEVNTGDEAADMFSQPVTDKEIFQRHINSNGEAMSAYMMCAGLWVACLAFCLMFSPFKTSLKDRKTFVSHGFISLFVAVVSPVIMVGLIMAIDGMRPAHTLLTFAMAILTSVAFMSIVYFLNTLMDSIGSFILLVFLCLNLSGSAGTYPINLSPKFFQVIHNFMPFTYGVDSFRSTISTGNPLTKDIIVLACITIVCVALTCITYEVRRKRINQKKA